MDYRVDRLGGQFPLSEDFLLKPSFHAEWLPFKMSSDVKWPWVNDRISSPEEIANDVPCVNSFL
jgi:hypothetical protein